MNSAGQSILDSPYARTSVGPTPIVDALGRVIPRTDDPAWQPPRDPLSSENVRQRAGVIHREVPLIGIQTGWSPPSVRGALEQLITGQFDQPSQLVDNVLGDSRVQSAMASRSGGLLGRPLEFVIPPRHKDDPDAKKCLRAWRNWWPSMASEPALASLQTWGIMLGFGVQQILWDTSRGIWRPTLAPWHPRYTYYHWTLRTLVAITLDGQTPVTGGDGHWLLHAPFGEYLGWMRSAIRALSPWWLARNYALRDWARWCEREGLPLIKAHTPAGGDIAQIQQFRASLSQLGQETIVELPTSANPEIGSFDLDYLESKAQGWESFRAIIEQCNSEITLPLLGQNLTTEVKEGSFAAARVHADVRQAILEADARALSQTIYRQIARPFAALNFGNADYAPRTVWDVSPREDAQKTALALMQFAQFVFYMRNAGQNVENVSAIAHALGIHLETSPVEPIQVEAKGVATPLPGGSTHAA